MPPTSAHPQRSPPLPVRQKCLPTTPVLAQPKTSPHRSQSVPSHSFVSTFATSSDRPADQAPAAPTPSSPHSQKTPPNLCGLPRPSRPVRIPPPAPPPFVAV